MGGVVVVVEVIEKRGRGVGCETAENNSKY